MNLIKTQVLRGATDVSDVITVLQPVGSGAFSDITDAQEASADVNGDGRVDVSDIIRMLQHIANPSVSLNPNK